VAGPRREIDWFVWRAGQYERLPADAAGVIRSEVSPGLWLDPAALLSGDLVKVLAVPRPSTPRS
jgi:hypothetical protein